MPSVSLANALAVSGDPCLVTSFWALADFLNMSDCFSARKIRISSRVLLSTPLSLISEIRLRPSFLNEEYCWAI